MIKKYVVAVLVWTRVGHTVTGEIQVTRVARVEAFDPAEAKRLAARVISTLYPDDQLVRTVLVREEMGEDKDDGDNDDD